MEDYEKIYEEFWKGIVENPDGSLNLDQIKRELADFKALMTSASEVFMHVTCGRVSKPNTLAEVVILWPMSTTRTFAEKKSRTGCSRSIHDGEGRCVTLSVG